MSRRFAVAAVVVVVAAVGACAKPADPYTQEIERWRATRLTDLTADDGWLTLAGLYWLKSGVNRLGTDVAAEIILPAGKAPSAVGTLTVGDDESLRFEAASGVAVTVEGAPVSRTTLVADDPGPPTKLHLGRLTFYVIKRHGRFALRLKDNDSLVRKQFAGIEAFAIDPAWRVRARFERYEPPHTLTFATALGSDDSASSPGAAVLEVEGQTLRLEAMQDPGEQELSFVFGDLTNGHETYGGGRFLDTPPPKDGELVLDFNQAYNPPCAFTPYATCPLPTRENKLPVRATAGEKSSAHH